MVQASCRVCGKREVDEGIKLRNCSKCKSIAYCSKECQRSDWKDGGHKLVCGALNVGDAQQFCCPEQVELALAREEWRDKILSGQSYGNGPDFKLFFDLFFKSQEESSHDETVKKMKKIWLKQTKLNKDILLAQILVVLINAPTAMFELPTSPLKIALEFVDPDAFCRRSPRDSRLMAPLHLVAQWADPRDEDANRNLCILGKQLLEAGADANRAGDDFLRDSPLHLACSSDTVTNLDHGANSNATNSLGETPLHCTLPCSPGAAKYLLEYAEGIDPNIVVSSPESEHYGGSFLANVRAGIIVGEFCTRAWTAEDEVARGQFLLEQLVELEEILVQRGALEINEGED